MRFHPLANLFPLIEGAAFDEFVESVRAAGGDGAPWPPDQRIVLIDEGEGPAILDGRNRFRALVAAGVLAEDADPDDYAARPYFRRFDPDVDGDPLACVIRLNLHRRHLDEGQRAMVAAKLANIGHGGARRTHAANLPLEMGSIAAFAAAAEREADGADAQKEEAAASGIAQAAAAEMLNVSPRSLRSARAVLDDGAAELQHAVEQGDVAVSVAAELARLPVDEQRRIIEGADKRAISGAAKALRAQRQAEKKARRETRERDLGSKQRALPERRYGVIYADPEWRFEPFSRDSGMDRAADNHYPTSALDEIKARPVADIAADDCVLFLWATAPMLLQALEVMSAWGFAYKSHTIWRKAEIKPGATLDKARLDRGAGTACLVLGTGYWFINAHELLLVGVRGAPVCPAQGQQFPSVIDAPPGRHSAKPERFAEMIDDYFPNLPKIELNARAARAGWDAWGLEAPTAEGAS